MPTYLAAFAICDYEHVSRTERGKEVSEGDPPGKGTFVLAADRSGTPASGAMPTYPTVPSWISPKPCYHSQRGVAERDATVPTAVLQMGFYGKAPH